MPGETRASGFLSDPRLRPYPQEDCAVVQNVHLRQCSKSLSTLGFPILPCSIGKVGKE